MTTLTMERCNLTPLIRDLDRLDRRLDLLKAQERQLQAQIKLQEDAISDAMGFRCRLRGPELRGEIERLKKPCPSKGG